MNENFLSKLYNINVELNEMSKELLAETRLQAYLGLLDISKSLTEFILNAYEEYKNERAEKVDE